MMRMRFLQSLTLTIAATALLGLGLVAPAQACTVSSVGGAISCQESLQNNDKLNPLAVNEDNLFGGADNPWTFVEKGGDGSEENIDIGLTITFGLDNTAGSYAFDAAAYDLFDPATELMLVLKAGPRYIGYLLGQGVTSGSWSTNPDFPNPKGNAFQDLSHMSVYARVVPIPAAVWLFGSALGGLGFIARRRKRLAA